MRKLILVSLIFFFGCTNNQTTMVPMPQPTAQPTTTPPDKNSSNEQIQQKTDEEQAPPLSAGQTDLTPTTPPPIGPPSPNPSPSPEPPLRAVASVPEAKSGILSEDGTAAIGPTVAFDPTDSARVQYYRAFVAPGSTLSAEAMTQLLFKDPDFNRAVAVIGELYRQDRLHGTLSPEMEAKFQELGQRVGAAVLVYNQGQRAQHYKNLAKGFGAGAVVGAVAGGLLMKEEWVPEFVKTRFGERLPIYARDALLGGIVGGGTVLVTMETYHIIDDLAHPQHIYNADPLLDGPTR